MFRYYLELLSKNSDKSSNIPVKQRKANVSNGEDKAKPKLYGAEFLVNGKSVATSEFVYNKTASHIGIVLNIIACLKVNEDLPRSNNLVETHIHGMPKYSAMVQRILQGFILQQTCSLQTCSNDRTFDITFNLTMG